jgi:hypothetical protein
VGSVVAAGVVLGWVALKVMPFVVISSFGFDGLIVFVMLVVAALLDATSLSLAKMEAHWPQTLPGAPDARAAFHVCFLGMLIVCLLISLLWRLFKKLDIHQRWALSVDVVCVVVGLVLWVGVVMTWGMWVANVHPIQVYDQTQSINCAPQPHCNGAPNLLQEVAFLSHVFSHTD